MEIMTELEQRVMDIECHIACDKFTVTFASFLNKEECACFHCLAKFNETAIFEFAAKDKNGEEHALCPKCGVDSVIFYDKDKIPNVTRNGFLERMKKIYFY